MKITRILFEDMCLSLEKTVAVYELLHTHARGQTDFTEDQLANVVTGVAMEARDTLRRARRRAHGRAYGPPGWTDEALARAHQGAGG